MHQVPGTITWRYRAACGLACAAALGTGAGVVFGGNWAWGHLHKTAAAPVAAPAVTVTAPLPGHATSLPAAGYTPPGPPPGTPARQLAVPHSTAARGAATTRPPSPAASTAIRAVGTVASRTQPVPPPAQPSPPPAQPAPSPPPVSTAPAPPPSSPPPSTAPASTATTGPPASTAPATMVAGT